MDREFVQKRAGEALNDNSGHGILLISMRLGKTKIVIDYIKRYSSILNNILWVSPTTVLRDEQIPAEFRKWRAGRMFDKKVKSICYNSLHKETDSYDLIVLDECQRLTTLNMEYFYNLPYKKVIGLTGTLPRAKDKLANYKYLNLDVIYKKVLDEAVSINAVAPYEITIVEQPLEEERSTVKITYKNQRTGKESTFYTTEAKRYKYLSNKFEELKLLHRNTKFAALARMRFIHNLVSKEGTAKRLITKLSNMRVLIFCGTIAQAERLCPHTYHSKTDKTDLEAFQSGKVDHLAVVDAANVGLTFENMDAAIIVSSNSSSIISEQRIGRILLFRKEYVGKIYVLCSTGTVQESWVNNAFGHLDQSNVKRINYQSI